MAIEEFFGTAQVLPVQSIDGVDDALECSSIVTDVIDPSEEDRGVYIAHAEAEY